MKKYLSLINLLGAFILGGLILSTPIASATFRVVQTPIYHLYTGESGSATTMRITPYPKDLDGTKLTMSDFGDTPTITVDPGKSGIEEIESFTGITDNGDGTATLTGLSRDLLSKYPYTTAGTGRAHGSGSTVVFGNNPQIYGRLGATENANSWTGIDTFASTSPPRYDLDPGAAAFTAGPGTMFVSMDQLGRTAIAGASNATRALQGLFQVAFRGQAASSTPLGTTGAFAALTTDIATSSPSLMISTSSVVITGIDSRINPLFISTSTLVTYLMGNLSITNGFLSTASSTFTATTTIGASNALSNALVLNGVKLAFPSTQCALGQSWYNNGSGTLSCSGTPRYTLAGAAGVNIGVSTFGTSSVQFALPANTLSASSTIEIYGSGVINESGAGSGTVFIRSSVTGVTLAQFSPSTGGAAVNSYNFHAIITGTSTTASEQTYVTGTQISNTSGSTNLAIIDVLTAGNVNLAAGPTLTVALKSDANTNSFTLTNLQYIVNP